MKKKLRDRSWLLDLVGGLITVLFFAAAIGLLEKVHSL